MKNKTIKFFCILITFLFLFGLIPQNVMAYSLKDTFTYDSNKGLNPEMEYHTGNLFIIGYTGILNSGQLRVVDIDSNGNIGSNISLFTFTSKAYSINVIKISDNYFVVSYLNSTLHGYLETFFCSDSGNFIHTRLDIELLSSSIMTNYSLKINKVKDNIYLITYQIGLVIYAKTIKIDNLGIISTVYQTRTLFNIGTFYKANYSLCLIANKTSYHEYIYLCGYTPSSITKISFLTYGTFRINDTGSFANTSSRTLDISSVLGVAYIYYTEITLIKILSNGYYSFVFSIEWYSTISQRTFFSFRCSDLFILDATYLNYKHGVGGYGLATVPFKTIQIDVSRFIYCRVANIYYFDIDINGLLSNEVSLIVGMPTAYIFNIKRVSSNGVYCILGISIAYQLFTYDGFPSFGYVGNSQEEETTTEELNTIYIKFIDASTGLPMTGVFNDLFIGPLQIGTNIFHISSDLFDDDNDLGIPSGVVQETFYLTIPFIDSTYHYLNVTCRQYYTGIYYINYTNSFKWYSGYTYTVVLYPTGFSLWENEDLFTSDGLTYGIRTDKFIYSYQEQVRIQIKMPTVAELQAKGKNINNYWVHGKNTSFLSGDIYNEKAFLFGSWQDMDSFTPILPPTGIQEMRFGIDYKTTVFWFIPVWEWLCSVYINIYDYATPYIPHGNITTITPVNPVIGETVTIVFNANNNGNINILNIGTQKIIYDEDFLKPVGNGYITYSFSGIGYYRIQLKVWSGTSLHLNDTHYLWVNGSGSEYEDWGYKTEYLTVEDNFLISGYDYLVIFYKSKINNTEIRVKSPSGSYMPFGTTVSNITSGTYKVKLPEWVRLGEYNITMNTSSGVLFETFKVVADEFNYAEFTSNSYSLNSTISFYLRHNKRCKVIILKDGVPYGQDYFFDNLTMPEGYFQLTDKSFFTTGIWTLELWETNNQIPRKLLSSDTTNIYYEQVKQPKQTYDNLFTISAPFTYIAGTILTLFCLILPALLIRKANIQSEILKYVPLFSGIFGFILSCMMGFFPWYAIFGLILVLVIVLAVIYQSKKGQ